MKVLVTGGSGFIGARLIYFLRKKKIDTIGASRNKKKFNKKINWDSIKSINNICKNVDIIVNCAGFDVHLSRNKKTTFKVNSQNPYLLYKEANKNGVKLFIFISTFHVYKKTNSRIINEKSLTRKKNLYTQSKLDGEKKLINFKRKRTKLIILRPCNLFGAPMIKNKNCWNLLINSLVASLIKNSKAKILSKENSFRNYSSMESFCEFILKIIRSSYYIKKYNNIINYTSDKNLNIKNIINIILKRLKKFYPKSYFDISYQYQALKTQKKFLYNSLYQKKFKSKRDKNFIKEIDNLIAYCSKKRKNI